MEILQSDLAIVGAGPAGSTCACSALAAMKGGLRVSLIDRETFPRDKSCGDAIRDEAVSTLEELNLGTVFSGRPRIERIASTLPSKFQFMDNLVDFDQHSYHVIERKVFDHKLYEAAVGGGACDLTGHALVDAAFDQDALLWNLTLKGNSGSGLSLQAKILVGADGAGSLVRRLTGIKLNKKSHMAVGIRAYAQAEGMDTGSMRIDYPGHFLPGYGWTFPLLNQTVNIGIFLDNRDHKSIGKSLQSHLEDYIDFLAGSDITVNNVREIKTHSLPLFSPELPLVPQRHVALIGDAAAMINPFTGEGIHFGIWSGFTLGQAISEGLQKEDLQASMQSHAESFNRKFADHMSDSQDFRSAIRYQRMFQ